MKHHCIKKCVGTYLWIIFLTIALTACGHSKEAILLEQIESTKSDQSVEDVEGETSIENKEEQFLSVYICGAVKHPDVYQLLEGARIKDAVEKAMSGCLDGRVSVGTDFLRKYGVKCPYGCCGKSQQVPDRIQAH